MNSWGSFNWFVIAFGLPLMALMIVAVPATDILLQAVFVQLDAATTTLYINLIKIALGMIAFILALGIMWVVASSITQRSGAVG